jgi:glutaredoxin
MKRMSRTNVNTLIGASWCAPCKQVKGFLDNRGIDYEYVDIDTDVGMELARDWSIRSVPSMEVDGNIITGDKAIMEAFSE